MKTKTNMKTKTKLSDELLYIVEQCKEKKACSSQLNPFANAIYDKNYTLACQIALGNIDWLKKKKINYPDNIEELAKNTAIKYHDNGNMLYKYKTKDLIKHGFYNQWHYNGILHIKCKYKDDMLHGLYEEWYDNEQLFIRCIYKDNLLYETYKACDRNNKLIRYFNANKFITLDIF